MKEQNWSKLTKGAKSSGLSKKTGKTGKVGYGSGL